MIRLPVHAFFISIVLFFVFYQRVRYGTLPKGARIGAYLESLRQSGMGSEPPEGVDMDDDDDNNREEDEPLQALKSTGHASLLRQAVNNRSDDPRLRPGVNKNSTNSSKTPPPTIRSQSVSGGDELRTPSPKPRSGSSHSGLRSSQPVRNSRRENSPQAAPPNLADLEFPPPPPPLEDDMASSSALDDEAASASCDDSSPEPQPEVTPPVRGPVPSPRSGHNNLKSGPLNVQLRPVSPTVDKVDGRHPQSPPEDQFFLGEEVNVEENSLKKNLVESSRNYRERPANDSPESGGGLATSRSVDSIASSDIGLQSTPAPTESQQLSTDIMSQSMFGILRTPSWDDNLQTESTTRPIIKPLTPRNVHLGSELKDRADSLRASRDSSMENLISGQQPPSVTQVSELFENLRLKAGRKPGSVVESDQQQQQKDAELMAPPPHPTPGAKPIQPRTGSGNKPSDIKVDSSCQETTFDFKSRLRKVEKTEKSETPTTETSTTTTTTISSPPKINKINEKTIDDFDDKRKSSGSINSLKRMWEKEREQQQQLGQQQRISVKGNNETGLPNTKPPPPPVQSTPDKPVVPVKPSLVKPLKNSASAAIYATPTASVPNAAKPPVANRSSVYAKSSGPSAPLVIPAAADDSSGGVEGGERQKIVALCSEAEQILSQSHSTPTQWMGLLANVHSLCHTYADCVAPHGRFHFRQLIAKLETQTKEMKQTSVIGPLRNSSEHSRLVGDVKNTVRDLANALQR